MKLSRSILALIILAAVFYNPLQIVNASNSQVNNSTLVSIHASNGPFKVGDITTIEVWVENVIGLYGADIQLHFSPIGFQVIDSNPNSDGVQVQMRNDLIKPGFILHREANNQTGTVWYANCQVNPASPASGSGALFEFQVIAFSPGTFTITVDSHQLSNKDGSSIASGEQAGQFLINGQRVLLPLVIQTN
jgi:hypothetical protein